MSMAGSDPPARLRAAHYFVPTPNDTQINDLSVSVNLLFQGSIPDPESGKGPAMERCDVVLTVERDNGGPGSVTKAFGNALVPGVRRTSFVVARLCFCAFMLVTAAYCLLAYIPFTYQWVINYNLVGWLPGFVKCHPYLYWLALVMVAATLVPDLRRGETRRLAVGFLLGHAAVGVGLVLRPVLSGIENDGISFIWSVAWLFPLLWLGAIDYVAKAGEIRWTAVAERDSQVLLAACLTAVFLSALYASLFCVRLVRNGSDAFPTSDKLIAFSVSVASHLFAFALLFASLKLINSISRRFSRGAKVEFLLCHLLAAGFSAVVIRKTILPAIAFNNGLAALYSLAAGLSIAVFLMGLSLRLHRSEEQVSRGLRMALGPITLPGLSSHYGIALWAALAWLFAWAVPAAAAMKDWDFLLQKLSAIAIWPISFAAFYTLTSRARNRQFNTAVVMLIAASAFAIYKQVDASRLRLPFLNGATIDMSAALERYSAYDVSLRVIREISSKSTNDSSFYEYLREYTNILPSTRVAPVPVNLVDNLKRTEGNKPNIFIFVVDSFRRDYLSPYNKTVRFTPNIDAFAQDSVVMENAFTRYGGTALSEPAIWAGAMLLHKQYVLPFYPMNSLQKLVDTDDYQSFISMDPILKELLRPSPWIVELDKRPDAHNFDFCWSLKELEKGIDERQTSRPVFAYAQPWNIHTHIIATEGRTVPDGEEYPGFWAPYASRVKYMDACFGEFIEYLKARGLYDNSVVILTSDHGDALGEDGRWGHSYWVFPEIMRIPLIMHLPPKLRGGLTWNSKAATFSTDITPSLYYLLGHKPIVANKLFGRPLFTATEQERIEYLRESYVVASSYGAAYGVVGGDGRWLFVADGVRDKDYFFDLSGEGDGRLNPFTSNTRIEQQQLIRDYIGAINQFYNITEKPQTAGAFDIGWQGRPKGEQ